MKLMMNLNVRIADNDGRLSFDENFIISVIFKPIKADWVVNESDFPDHSDG